MNFFGEVKNNVVIEKTQNRGKTTKKYFFKMERRDFNSHAHLIGDK